jgi:hypothetical protein
MQDSQSTPGPKPMADYTAGLFEYQDDALSSDLQAQRPQFYHRATGDGCADNVWAVQAMFDSRVEGHMGEDPASATDQRTAGGVARSEFRLQVGKDRSDPRKRGTPNSP